MTKSKKWNQPHKQPTIRQLRAWRKEEFETSRMYRSYGFDKQAKQEHQHGEFFDKKIKNRGNAPRKKARR